MNLYDVDVTIRYRVRADNSEEAEEIVLMDHVQEISSEVAESYLRHGADRRVQIPMAVSAHEVGAVVEQVVTRSSFGLMSVYRFFPPRL